MPKLSRCQLDTSSESESKILEQCDQSLSQLLDEEAVEAIQSNKRQSELLPTPSSSKFVKKISTPFNIRDGSVEDLESRPDQIIAAQRCNLKKIRQKAKADNAEFLSIVRSETSEDQVVMNNEESPPAFLQGEDLMKMVAGHDPGHFGRELVKKIFGVGCNSLLVNYMFGHERSKTNARDRVDMSLERTFETVVRQKYPRKAEYCLRIARGAANQLGLDYRKTSCTEGFVSEQYLLGTKINLLLYNKPYGAVLFIIL